MRGGELFWPALSEIQVPHVHSCMHTGTDMLLCAHTAVACVFCFGDKWFDMAQCALIKRFLCACIISNAVFLIYPHLSARLVHCANSGCFFLCMSVKMVYVCYFQKLSAPEFDIETNGLFKNIARR